MFYLISTSDSGGLLPAAVNAKQTNKVSGGHLAFSAAHAENEKWITQKIAGILTATGSSERKSHVEEEIKETGKRGELFAG